MSREIRADYSQNWLFPPSLDDLLPVDHPARFIREFVDSLDLKAMGFKERKGEDGRPNYAADLLLKVWLYGYLERIRSTRRLERACHQHVALMWLTGMNYPDHSSLWRFWRDHRGVIKELFRKTVRVAADAGLVGMVLHALDGTKITARGSTRKVWNRKELKKRLRGLEESIERAMQEVEAAESEETGEYRLPEELAGREKLRETIREKLAELEREEREQMHPEEKDAQLMKSHEGLRLAYNAQVVVDDKCGMIVVGEVTDRPNDKQELVPMLEQVEEELGRVAEETVTDAGYCSGEQLARAEAAGYPVLVSMAAVESEERKGGEYHRSKFIYDEQRDVWTCPRGEPLYYETMRRHRDKSYEARLYRCQNFRDCPVRWECSVDPRGRSLEISPHLGAVLRQKEKQRDPAKAKQLSRRIGIVEPVFSRVKHSMEFRRWSVGGLEKVNTEWLFLCALMNLSKLYHYWKEGKLQLA